MGTRKRKPNGRTITWTLTRSVGLALALALALATADASERAVRIFKIDGIPATGLNDVCGELIAELPLPPPLNHTHFTFVGEFNPSPGAEDAIPLSQANCRDDILLATTTDPLFSGPNSIFGLPDADKRLKNLLLRNVAVSAGFFDGVREQLPPMGSPPANPLPVTRSEPNSPIRLGDWFKARGHMEIRCFPDGTARVEAVFRKLFPNRVYSLAAIWSPTLPGTPPLLPLAFGGVPNAITTNEAGFARFQRDLNACPMDPTDDGSRMLFVDLGFHSDSSLHGVFPFVPLEEGVFKFDGITFTSVMPPGVGTHVQMAFPIIAKPR